MEHGLPKKRRPQLHSIESADEFSRPPDFQGMGQAQPVKGRITALNQGTDPCFFPAGTGGYHLIEGRIAPDVPVRVLQNAPRSMRHMKIVQGNDPAWIRGKTADAAVIHRHGKPPRSVKPEKLLRWNQGGFRHGSTMRIFSKITSRRGSVIPISHLLRSGPKTPARHSLLLCPPNSLR